MSIRLEINGDSVIEFDQETITLGSDPSCTVPFPSRTGLAPKHAVIRRIAGRWIVEVRDAESIQVGDSPATRMHWLNSGDVIMLTDQGPAVRFEPDRAPTKSSPQPSSAPPQKAGFSRPVLRSTANSDSEAPPPLEPDTLQLSAPSSSIVLPPFHNVVEPYEMTIPATDAKPAPPASVAKSASVTKEDEFKEGSPSRTRPVLLKSTSWLDNSATAASDARQKLAARRLWMKVAGVSVLATVAVAIWQFGSGGSNRDPDTKFNVRMEQRTESASTKASKDTAGDGPLPETLNPVSKPGDSSNKAPDPVVEAPVVSKSPKPGGNGPSSTLVEVRNGVYAVFAMRENDEGCFRIGTAWAASRRNLVTSGAVALAVEELQREGLIIVVSQPFQDRPITIKAARVHAAYRQAMERAAVAREQIAANQTNPPLQKQDDSFVPPEEELTRARGMQARFDIGVLDIAMGQRLPNPLKIDSNELPDVAKNDFLLVGFPFDSDDFRAKSVFITDDAKERLNPKGSAAKSESNLTLTMTFPEDVASDNWSGSPIFNRNRRVIGVYSRASKPAENNSKPTPTRHAVIWLGRLREFAPEVEE